MVPSAYGNETKKDQEVLSSDSFGCIRISAKLRSRPTDRRIHRPELDDDETQRQDRAIIVSGAPSACE